MKPTAQRITWTKTSPTIPGLYWCLDSELWIEDGEPFGANVYFDTSDPPGGQDRLRFTINGLTCWADHDSLLWSGPLPAPPRPRKGKAT